MSHMSANHFCPTSASVSATILGRYRATILSGVTTGKVHIECALRELYIEALNLHTFKHQHQESQL